MILANLRASAWKYGACALAVLAVAAIVAAVIFRGSAAVSDLRATTAETRAKGLAGQLAQARDVIAIERRKAQDMAAIAAQHERDKADAEVEHDRDLAALRNGHLKLRKHWTCPVPGTATTPGERDAAADLRAADAAAAIAITRAADDQVRAAQAVIEADREQGE